MAFEVTDVDAAYGRLTEAGYRTTCPSQKLRGGRSKVIYVLAPEHNAVELIEFLAPLFKLKRNDRPHVQSSE
jgi:hypothetical protein